MSRILRLGMLVQLACRPVAPHPILELRDFIERELPTDLPDGVYAVSPGCADPQFLPGASGLMTASSWAEVIPGSEGLTSSFPPAPVGRAPGGTGVALRGK